MKKKYLMPDSFEAEMDLLQMIAASDPKKTLYEEDADPDGEVLSRQRTVWEEDAIETEDF